MEARLKQAPCLPCSIDDDALSDARLAVFALKVGRANASRIQIDGAGEAIPVPVLGSAPHLEDTDHPIAAARSVVNVDAAKIDVTCVELVGRTIANRLATASDGALGCVDREVTAIAAVTIPAVALTSVAIARPRTWRRWRRRRRQRLMPAPDQVESVAFRSTLRILDVNHGDAAAAGVANERLTSTSIDAFESKGRRICRHEPVALEPPEIRPLSGKCSNGRHVAAYFDFRDGIDNHLDRTLAMFFIAARDHGAACVRCLCVGCDCKRSGYAENLMHASPLATQLA